MKYFFQFLPTIISQYLFIFVKLDEDNISSSCKIILKTSPLKYF